MSRYYDAVTFASLQLCLIWKELHILGTSRTIVHPAPRLEINKDRIPVAIIVATIAFIPIVEQSIGSIPRSRLQNILKSAHQPVSSLFNKLENISQLFYDRATPC